MKKLVAMLVLMLMALPAFAINEITITAVDSGSGVLSVYYNVDPASESDPVGIALGFACSDAATTTSAGVSAEDPCFPVYLDFAHDAVGPNFDPCTWDPCNPLYAVGDGNPLAMTDQAGVPAGAVSAFSVCMGRLDQPAPAKGVAHKLCDIQLAQGTAAFTDVTIAADSLRGGVVGSVFTVNVPATPVRVTFGPVDCYTGPDFATWVSVGKPDCWCAIRQCHGDADGLEEAYGRNNALRAWVGDNDIAVLAASYRAAVGAENICADFDHAVENYGRNNALSTRVGDNDISILATWYRSTAVPTDCNP